MESAYRIIPIHPNDHYLFGMQLQGNHFVDMALPFGLRSAPYIFSSVVDLVEWVLKKQYDVSFLLHYLDDFHTLGPLNAQTCQRNLDTCIQQFQDWGIPLHPDKLEGPSTLLFPIVLAASLWGHQWSAKRVEFHSDNTAVVRGFAVRYIT